MRKKTKQQYTVGYGGSSDRTGDFLSDPDCLNRLRNLIFLNQTLTFVLRRPILVLKKRDRLYILL
jgi:hypothetical protein